MPFLSVPSDLHVFCLLPEYRRELPRLAEQIREDHMFVVITARKGTISYKTALERLPKELMQHFSGKNLMILFPDQYGTQKEESMTFTAAQHQEESSIYDVLARWMNSSPKLGDYRGLNKRHKSPK